LAQAALTGVKILEKITPEQVQAPAPDQVLPGKAHDFTYFLSVAGLETVDLAMLAGRFVSEGATQAPLESIQQEVPALRADGVFVQRKLLKRRFFGGNPFPAPRVLDTAIDLGEL